MLLEPDTHNRMQDFVEALLRHQGALVEPIEPQGLDVIAPPEVQRALGVGELSRLGFGANLPPMAKRIGMEGDWLDWAPRAVGRAASCRRPPRPPGIRNGSSDMSLCWTTPPTAC
jgi:hypothetical protein